MAGDDDGHAVVRTRAGYGAHRAGLADRRRDLAVRARLAVRHAAQRFPHLQLERGGAEVERELDRRRAPFEMIDDRHHRLSERRIVRAADRRVRQLIAQAPLERFLRVAERHRADAAVGHGDEECAEGGRDGREADEHVASAVAISPRRHAEPRVRLRVEAAARTVSGFVCCGGHVRSLLQLCAQPLGAAGGEVLLRRDARLLAEHALQVMRTHAGALREFGERDAVRVGIEQSLHLRDQ
jgi:hypothetical protein